MNNNEVIREWFGGVRAAADAAVALLDKPPALNTIERVRVDMLLRQYLRAGLERHIRQAEGVSLGEAQEICETVYSELIQDTMTGIWTQADSMAMMSYFRLLSESGAKPALFKELLRRALDAEVSDKQAAAVRNKADEELWRFVKERKAVRS